MNCKISHDLILTDYIDGQLTDIKKDELERHLAVCPRCRHFLDVVQSSTVGIFSEDKSSIVLSSEAVWEGLKARIELENKQMSARSFVDVVALIKERFFPRPSYAAAFAAALVLCSLLVGNQFYRMDVSGSRDIEETVLTLSYVAEELSSATVDDPDDYGTAIEEYFL